MVDDMIHQRILAAVEAADMSIADVARAVGWSYATTWRVLHGETQLSADDVALFAQILGTTTGALYAEAAS